MKMPRNVSQAEIHSAIHLMTTPDENGSLMGQREIERVTGLSRPYLRKLAKQVGHQFPRNGVEVVGKLCMCANCGAFFRRPPSKVDRAKNNFCDDTCKQIFMKGPNHPSWKHGKTAESFSKWIKNQAAYDVFRNAVLERDGHRCVISGRADDLDVHHIIPKAEKFSPEKALDVSNGITLNKEVHRQIHDLIRDGVDFEEAIKVLKDKYASKEAVKEV